MICVSLKSGPTPLVLDAVFIVVTKTPFIFDGDLFIYHCFLIIFRELCRRAN
jgi:hypothetical protein